MLSQFRLMIKFLKSALLLPIFCLSYFLLMFLSDFCRISFLVDSLKSRYPKLEAVLSFVG